MNSEMAHKTQKIKARGMAPRALKIAIAGEDLNFRPPGYERLSLIFPISLELLHLQRSQGFTSASRTCTSLPFRPCFASGDVQRDVHFFEAEKWPYIRGQTPTIKRVRRYDVAVAEQTGAPMSEVIGHKVRALRTIGHQCAKRLPCRQQTLA